MQWLSRAVFGLASLVLMGLALGLIVQGVYYPLTAVLQPGSQGKIAFLSGVGYVIIAIAVFDVAKFLIEEEVVLGRERQSVAETRRSLTKFVSTIAMAALLEALVTVFRVSSEDPALMLYPTLLLVAGTGLIVGLGLFQRLSATTERQVSARDGAETGDRKAG
ncbi:MAG TPA: GNAT family acetyltransferase [Beijerinckiaceae bacterium]|nr:GNAT family acetyltransferase [Beijerinckiaceae bacterium]